MVNGKDIEIEIINRIISKDYFLISKVKKKSSKKQEMWEMNRVGYPILSISMIL